MHPHQKNENKFLFLLLFCMAVINRNLRYLNKSRVGTASFLHTLHSHSCVCVVFYVMALAAIASVASINTNHHHRHGSLILPPKHHHPRIQGLRIRCNGTTNHDQESQTQNNALLKLAWYGSELLGIAASAFRPPSNEEAPQRLLETIDRAAVVDTIKQDFQRSYFVTGFTITICSFSLG